MRTLSHIALAFLLVAMVGGLWRVTPFDIATPDLALAVALYLGVSGRGRLWECTIAALMIGYLEDVVVGAPRGLGAFVVGAVCLLSRLATARLLVRGPLFTAVFAFLAALVAAVLTLATRIYLGAARGPLELQVMTIVASAFLTALGAPAVFRMCRWIDARFARTAREREALREGYLS